MRKAWLVIGGVLVVAIAFSFWFFLKQEKREKPKPPNVPNFLFKILGEPENVLRRPLAVTNQGGRIYVADGIQGQVQVFNKRGKFLFRFPVVSSPLKSSYLVGIAAGGQGKIYLSDLQSRRLMVVNSQGKYLSDFPKKKKTLKKPVALTFARGKLYVTDVGDQRVKVFDSKGKLLLQLGGPGESRGKFSFPNGVAVSEKGLIFVSDSNNHRVQVFDQKGQLKQVFGKKLLSLPRGIALDQFDRVHVADTFGFRVVVFNAKGDFLFSYLEPGIREAFPQGISIDTKSRRIYVTDRLNSWVSVWEY